MITFIDPTIEHTLKRVILPELEKGRKNFDRPHTEAVVHWMKQLLQFATTPVNAKVLITAAYAHDWGYIGLFEGVNSSDRREIAKRKPLHMERGAKMIGQLLNTTLHDHFSKKEIQKVQHLVAVHDQVERLRTESEILLMEADTLGMLDVDRVTPTFSPGDNQGFMKQEIFGRRFLHFVHPEALEIGKKLAQQRENFYQSKV